MDRPVSASTRWVSSTAAELRAARASARPAARRKSRRRLHPREQRVELQVGHPETKDRVERPEVHEVSRSHDAAAGDPAPHRDGCLVASHRGQATVQLGDGQAGVDEAGPDQLVVRRR